jgi:predicted RecB family nuclease
MKQPQTNRPTNVRWRASAQALWQSVLLAQGFQPLAQLRGEIRVVQREPAFVDDEAFASGGTIYLGRDGARTSIRFGSNLTKAENLLRDAERLQRADVPPKLLLNDHCRICAFRDRCRDKAIREDNLSLLRGIGEKTIKRYARKGILTLTQLAHTFRPRRRGKRADTPLTQRDHALHALAIATKQSTYWAPPQFQRRQCVSMLI